MTSFQASTRHYYWLMQSFFQKNIRLLTVSVIVSFFFILLLVNFFPVANSLFFRKKEKIGIVGNFDQKTLPTTISSLFSNPLVDINDKGKLAPVLSKSWEERDNNKIFTFYLKQNLKWDDGSAFVSEDIAYDFENVSVKYIDASTIEFHLSQPLSIFPVYLTKPLIKPPFTGVAGLYHVQNFKFDKDKNLKYINLVPNKPDIPYITYKFYESEDQLIAAYKRGEITKFETPRKSVRDLFSSWSNTHIERRVNYSQILTIFFNTESELLSSKDVRKALAHAIPRFEELGVEAAGPIPPLSWAYASDVKKYPYDSERAASILSKNTEATQQAALDLFTFYDYINVAEEIKTGFEQVGLDVNLRVLSYLPQDFDAIVTLWNPPQDPDQYYFWHSTQRRDNITHYKNVKVDKLLEDARALANIEERKAIYAEFQRVLMEDLPAFFLYHPYVYTIQRK